MITVPGSDPPLLRRQRPGRGGATTVQHVTSRFQVDGVRQFDGARQIVMESLNGILNKFGTHTQGCNRDLCVASWPLHSTQLSHRATAMNRMAGLTTSEQVLVCSLHTPPDANATW